MALAVAAIPATLDGVAASKEITIQFNDPKNCAIGPEIVLPLSSSREDLEVLLNSILENEESVPYTFRINLNNQIHELTSTLGDVYQAISDRSSERCLSLQYHPLALFRVRPVSRCSASIPGHTEAVLCAAFSPDSQTLATGSGDTTVRIWDLNTKTPSHTCQGHTNWVLCLAWSPDNVYLASAGMDSTVRVWKDGKPLGPPLSGHNKAVTGLCWEPLHLASTEKEVCRLASGSKDWTIRIWDIINGVTLVCLSSHTNMVTQIRWSGQPNGFIYSSSRDTTIKVWNTTTGRPVKELKGHAHWVNTLSLNTDQVLRSGPYDAAVGGGGGGVEEFATFREKQQKARERYEEAIKTCGVERLVSGSDDFTMFLWSTEEGNKPIARLTGHQKIVNQVVFSGDGRFIASASFDNSVKMWDGIHGKYITTYRGHIGSVYAVCFSSDNRLLCSCSSDSTVKLWDCYKNKLIQDLPGHADDVYALDWSPNGRSVATGSKDKIVKIWEH